MSSKPPIIKVEGISKAYTNSRVGVMQTSLKEQFTAIVAAPWRLIPGVGHQSNQAPIQALNPIHFELGAGERLGILGKNGSGKSTLLKILARITAPTTGTAELRGSVASILEVGTGFHPDLTGHENVYLNGAILGLRRTEIAASLDEIIEFSEMGDYMDLPVKRYSSGMFVRLAFSVLAHLKSDILLIDEVLAVGDQGFREKCLKKMDDEVKKGRTVIFVSHDVNAMESFTQRCLHIHQGDLVMDGPTTEVIADYHRRCEV
jgi:lipopolysaccharide transport system ATP-binding protein